MVRHAASSTDIIKISVIISGGKRVRNNTSHPFKAFCILIILAGLCESSINNCAPSQAVSKLPRDGQAFRALYSLSRIKEERE